MGYWLFLLGHLLCATGAFASDPVQLPSSPLLTPTSNSLCESKASVAGRTLSETTKDFFVKHFFRPYVGSSVFHLFTDTGELIPVRMNEPAKDWFRPRIAVVLESGDIDLKKSDPSKIQFYLAQPGQTLVIEDTSKDHLTEDRFFLFPFGGYESQIKTKLKENSLGTMVTLSDGRILKVVTDELGEKSVEVSKVINEKPKSFIEKAIGVFRVLKKRKLDAGFISVLEKMFVPNQTYETDIALHNKTKSYAASYVFYDYVLNFPNSPSLSESFIRSYILRILKRKLEEKGLTEKSSDFRVSYWNEKKEELLMFSNPCGESFSNANRLYLTVLGPDFHSDDPSALISVSGAVLVLPGARFKGTIRTNDTIYVDRGTQLEGRLEAPHLAYHPHVDPKAYRADPVLPSSRVEFLNPFDFPDWPLPIFTQPKPVQNITKLEENVSDELAAWRGEKLAALSAAVERAWFHQKEKKEEGADKTSRASPRFSVKIIENPTLETHLDEIESFPHSLNRALPLSFVIGRVQKSIAIAQAFWSEARPLLEIKDESAFIKVKKKYASDLNVGGSAGFSYILDALIRSYTLVFKVYRSDSKTDPKLEKELGDKITDYIYRLPLLLPPDHKWVKDSKVLTSNDITEIGSFIASIEKLLVEILAKLQKESPKNLDLFSPSLTHFYTHISEYHGDRPISLMDLKLSKEEFLLLLVQWRMTAQAIWFYSDARLKGNENLVSLERFKAREVAFQNILEYFIKNFPVDRENQARIDKIKIFADNLYTGRPESYLAHLKIRIAFLDSVIGIVRQSLSGASAKTSLPDVLRDFINSLGTGFVQQIPSPPQELAPVIVAAPSTFGQWVTEPKTPLPGYSVLSGPSISYDREHPLGEGLTSVVYPAQWGDRKGVVKILRSREFVEMTAQSLALTRRILSDPEIYDEVKAKFIAVDASDLNAPEPYVFMEDAGQSLEQIETVRKKIPLLEAVEILFQTTLGLSGLHSLDSLSEGLRGIPHNDIRPANILLKDGSVKLADPGAGIVVEDPTQLKASLWSEVEGALIGGSRSRAEKTSSSKKWAGNKDYYPPRKNESDHSDLRREMFALGTLWYDMLTGELPIGGDPLSSVLDSEVAAKLSVSTLQLLNYCFSHLHAQRPSDRYKNAMELLPDLESLKLKLEKDLIRVADLKALEVPFETSSQARLGEVKKVTEVIAQKNEEKKPVLVEVKLVALEVPPVSVKEKPKKESVSEIKAQLEAVREERYRLEAQAGVVPKGLERASWPEPLEVSVTRAPIEQKSTTDDSQRNVDNRSEGQGHEQKKKTAEPQALSESD